VALIPASINLLSLLDLASSVKSPICCRSVPADGSCRLATAAIPHRQQRNQAISPEIMSLRCSIPRGILDFAQAVTFRTLLGKDETARVEVALHFYAETPYRSVFLSGTGSAAWNGDSVKLKEHESAERPERIWSKTWVFSQSKGPTTSASVFFGNSLNSKQARNAGDEVNNCCLDVVSSSHPRGRLSIWL
jgi:hypothetical protein